MSIIIEQNQHNAELPSLVQDDDGGVIPPSSRAVSRGPETSYLAVAFGSG